MRDKLVDSGLDLEASQKEDEEDDRYREGVCRIFRTEMPQHLGTASTVIGLGGTETIAWGQSFRLD